jgi:adenylate cyclase
MNEVPQLPAQAEPNTSGQAPYRLSVEPVEGNIRVQIGGQVVADSGDVRVMHETYLPSACYFPKADLIQNLLAPSEFRSFCPFKGTAHHWHLQLSGGTIENGAWSYETPLAEAVGVAGMVAFYPHLVEEYLSEQPLPEAPIAQIAASVLIDWLLREAWQCKTPGALTEIFPSSLRKLVCRCGG